MNQLTLEDFSLFALIVSHLDLSAVARERDVPPRQVSSALARIAARTGVQLIHRTTHDPTITDDGEQFSESSYRMIGEHSNLQMHQSQRRGLVSGRVRIRVSQLFAEYALLPKIPPLLELHSLLGVETRINDRIVDLATESVDIVVRGEVAPAETMVVKPLRSDGRSLNASPAHLRTKGAPPDPDELNAPTLITNAGVIAHNQRTFQLNGAPDTRLMRGRVRVNSSAAVVSLVLAEVGISSMNQFVGELWWQPGAWKRFWTTTPVRTASLFALRSWPSATALPRFARPLHF